MKSYLRSFILILFILTLRLFLYNSPAWAQYFTIIKYQSDITIEKDSSFIVRERIDVDFQKPRHGIYREIPYKYRDEVGRTVTTPTKVLSVTNEEGKAWKYQVKKTGHTIHIRIGHPKNWSQENRPMLSPMKLRMEFYSLMTTMSYTGM